MLGPSWFIFFLWLHLSFFEKSKLPPAEREKDREGIEKEDADRGDIKRGDIKRERVDREGKEKQTRLINHNCNLLFGEKNG